MRKKNFSIYKNTKKMCMWMSVRLICVRLCVYLCADNEQWKWNWRQWYCAMWSFTWFNIVDGESCKEGRRGGKGQNGGVHTLWTGVAIFYRRNSPISCFYLNQVSARSEGKCLKFIDNFFLFVGFAEQWLLFFGFVECMLKRSRIALWGCI